MDYHERKRRLPYGALSAIAAELGVSGAYVSEVNRLGKGSPDVMKALAAVIGEKVEVVFPDARIVDLDAIRAKVRRAVKGRAA